MLQNVGKEVRECYRRAEACRRRADAATDPREKAEFLTMEERWLYLARSYEFCRTLSDFTAYLDKRIRWDA